MTSIAEHQSAVIQHLLDEVAGLRKRLESLESEIIRIVADYAPEVIELREVSKEQAREEIIVLFDSSESPLYYSDIEARLGIEYELVVEVCKELIEEGAIGLNDNSV